MNSRPKTEEVQFYLDRSMEALLMVLRSIIDNPRISDGERIESLRMLAGHHGSIADFISERIADGERKGQERRRADGLS